MKNLSANFVCCTTLTAHCAKLATHPCHAVHHYEVMGLSVEDQQKALRHAEETGISLKNFRDELRDEFGLGEQKKKRALPAQLKFRVIADELDKFALRDPATAKPKDRDALQGYVAQMQTWLDAFRKTREIE
jgi:hypothetical protein